jgi:hypothetical protein
VKKQERPSRDKTSSSSLEWRTVEGIRRGEEVRLSAARTVPRSRDVHADSAQMKFRGQADQSQMDATLRLEVPVIETLQEHESNEEGEDRNLRSR